LYSVTANRACENCVDAEQKNAKLNNRTWLNELLTIGEHNVLEEGKLIFGGACRKFANSSVVATNAAATMVILSHYLALTLSQLYNSGLCKIR